MRHLVPAGAEGDAVPPFGAPRCRQVDGAPEPARPALVGGRPRFGIGCI